MRLPLGLVLGLGMWLGLRQVRQEPPRGRLAAVAAVMALVCCGLLLWVRFSHKETDLIKPQRALKTVAHAPGVNPNEIPEEQARKGIAEFKVAQEARVHYSLFDITAGVYIFAHWALTGFTAQMLLRRNFRARGAR